MSVDRKHPDFKKWLPTADKMELVLEGEDAVYESTDVIKQLSGQNVFQYRDYKRRAVWYPFTHRTRHSLHGALFRREPMCAMPEALSYLYEEATPYGTGIKQLASETAYELFGAGRYGILVDIPEGSTRPQFLPYHGKNIINWQTTNINGKVDLSMVVLREYVCLPDPDDIFNQIEVEQYRVCRMEQMDSAWVYIQEVYRDDELVSQTVPMSSGQPFGYIPFVFFNQSDNGPCPQKSILYDLALMNIHHYRWSAEEGHGLHFVALPTPWIAGGQVQTEASGVLQSFPDPTNTSIAGGQVQTEASGVLQSFPDPTNTSIPRDQNGRPVRTDSAKPTFFIGSDKAWSLPKDASVGILETTGSGIGLIQGKLTKLVEYMQSIGARLLSDHQGNETATAIKIQKTSESNALSHIANVLDAGFTNLIAYAADFMGLSDPSIATSSIEEDVYFKVNREFISLKLSADEATKFWALFQQDAVEADVLVETFEKGELYPANFDKNAEVERLVEMKANPTPPVNLNNNQDPEDPSLMA